MNTVSVFTTMFPFKDGLVLGCNTVILFFRDFVHVRKSIPTFPYRKHHTVY